MNEIVKLFYEDIIPGILKGKINCDLVMNVCSNISFLENNKFIEADNTLNLDVPTLVIKNKNEFEIALTNYVNCVLRYNTGYQDIMSKQDHIKFIIACSFANMGTKDFLDPISYYQRLTLARLNMPIKEGCYDFGVINSQHFLNNIYINISEDEINQECPFKCEIIFKANDNVYHFQTIRFYILDNTAYIGAIQGKTSSLNKKYENEIRRLSYKINEGIEKNSVLANADPGACLALDIFTLFLNNNGINKMSLLPYGIIRFNSKKVLASELQSLIKPENEIFKEKVKEKITKTNFYFDNYKNFQNKLLNSFQRIAIQFDNCDILQNDIYPSVDISMLDNSNNKLLNSLCQQTIENKKTNYIK